MSRLFKTAILWLVLVVPLVLTSHAVADLIPTPTFSDHQVPTTFVPDTDSGFWEALDVGILLLALVVATYLALVDRSRRKLLVLSAASLFWFGFVRKGCVCSIGAIQNVALGAADPSFAVPTGVVAFFALPLVFTLFFGRTFCAAVCPLGAVQELTAVRSLSVPRWLDHALGLVPFIYLGAAVIFAVSGTAFIICRYDPFVAFFRLGGNADMLLFGSCVVLIGLFIGRPYCRYLCPYGAILSLLTRVSKWHLGITPSECINCQLCEESCPFVAIHPPTTPPSAGERALGKRRLRWLLLASPAIIGLLTLLGTWWAVPLSRMHPTIRLAEQVRLEELGQSATTTDASDAFRNTGRPASDLYSEAWAIRHRFVMLGGWLGAWVGLVLSVKLVSLSIRRRRVDYHPDRSGCVSCGRCFRSCPVELVRLGEIEDVAEMVEETPA